MFIVFLIIVAYIYFRIRDESSWSSPRRSSPPVSSHSSRSEQKADDPETRETQDTETTRAFSSPAGKTRTEKVVGTTYDNRQSVVRMMQVGEKVILRREPQNPHDGNAIRVERPDGTPIGYLSRDVASELAGSLDKAGGEADGTVCRVTGGTPNRPTRGLVIQFTVPADWHSAESSSGRRGATRGGSGSSAYGWDCEYPSDCDYETYDPYEDYGSELEDMVDWESFDYE